MNKFILVILALFFLQCTSIKKHNVSLNEVLSVKKMHNDVDYVYNKLKKFQPQLYQYISKEKLDYKFDSLKKSITKPIPNFEFFSKLSPVVSEIRQGHLITVPKTTKYSRKDKEVLKKYKNPFSQFDFEIFDGKVYIIENKSNIAAINKGDELLAINKEPISDFLKESRSWLTSDGFNTTYFDRILSLRLGRFYNFKHPAQDSVLLSFNNDKNFWVKKKLKDSLLEQNLSKKARYSKIEKDSLIKENRRLSKFGYDEDTKEFSRALTFTEVDSCTAIIKIKGFMNGNYSAFYNDAFKLLKESETENLIIDLRNNLGGRISEINKLYSFLTDTTYTFVNESEVTRKSSIVSADYFKGSKRRIQYVTKGLLAPFYYGIQYFGVKKRDDGKFYYLTNSRPQEASKNKFKGSIYVLTNGASFSASSILSTKLKGNKKAIFVGEETGGEYNGTVAGRTNSIELPNSKIKLGIGLMYVNAIEKTPIIGHGVYPDYEINPTLLDRLNNFDPEMDFILKDIEAKQIKKVTNSVVTEEK